MGAGVYKVVKLAANASLTSGLTHVRQIVLFSNNAAPGTLTLTETGTTFQLGASLSFDVPPDSGITPIEFECPGYRMEGVSVSTPASVSFLIVYEPGG